MKRLMANHKQKKAILIALAAPLMFSPAPLMAVTGTSEPVVAIARQAQTIVSVQRINPTTVDVVFSNNQRMTFDFYGDNIFRMFQDNNGGILRDPEAKPEARILVDTPRRPVSKLDIQDDNGQVTITTGKVRLQLDKSTALLKVTNLTTNKIVFEETKPVVYEKMCRMTRRDGGRSMTVSFQRRNLRQIPVRTLGKVLKHFPFSV